MIESYLKQIEELERRCQDLETIIETTSEHADFIEAELEKRNELLRHVFGRYLTQEVVDEILSVPDGQSLVGERREITVLSSDLRGFTAMAERLPAEDIIRILNCYFGIMSEVITHFGGTISSFLGDGIMVYFGAPIQMPDHARKALLCAQSMQAAMARVNDAMKERSYPALEMGIGINTGEVIVGNIGSEQRAQYGAVGGPVNMAFRIESYSLGGDVLASDTTVRAAGAGISIYKSTTAFPKGSPGPITIHSIGGVDGAPVRTIMPDETPLTALKEPAPVQIWLVQGKDVALTPRAGLVVRLGKNTAALRFVEAAPMPAILANLRLELAGSGEAYAKVTALEEEQGQFVVRLTQHSPGFERWLTQTSNNGDS